MALNNLRLAQKNIKSANTLFNGVLAVTLVVTDPARLKFNANIRAFTGDVGTPHYDFVASDEYGKPKNFGDIDDVVTWLRGAYLDITDLTFVVEGMDLISKTFEPPLDPIKDATTQKARFTKLRDGIADNLAKVTAQVAAAVASGWDLVTAHPALQANYAEYVKQQAAVTAIHDFYVAEIARYNLIINPA